MTPDVQRLRLHAISQCFFAPTTLKAALHRLAFVQADPIRSPARAQDLILRHRVKGYRAGDLERRYPFLDVEEDVLYAYGFLSRPLWRLLHPRDRTGITELQKKVLKTVGKFGQMHPRELEAHFGRERVINAWGGYSKATTRALDDLHYRGLLRIARRENGVRIYEAAATALQSVSPQQRLRKIIAAIAALLAPMPEKSLQAVISRTARRQVGEGAGKEAVKELVRTGEFARAMVEGLSYVWPACVMNQQEAPRRVRFLAPFDPLVWDRRRFEHLWGWAYRFEAYTPPVKRLRGYYAMPLLWADEIVGWANAGVAKGQLEVQVGFIKRRPRDSAFQSELANESERMREFLGLGLPSK